MKRHNNYERPACTIVHVGLIRLCDGSLPMTDDRVDHFDARSERWEDETQAEGWNW